MRSSNIVIKAAVIKIDRQHPVTPFPVVEASNGGAVQPSSPGLDNKQSSARDQFSSENEEKVKFVRREAYELGWAKG